MHMKTAQSIDPSIVGTTAGADDPAEQDICLEVKDLKLYYGESQALKGIKLKIPRKRVTAFIGPRPGRQRSH